MKFKNNTLAPIVLFVYNRPWHTKQTLEALKKAEFINDSILYVYSDGPKNRRDRKQVAEVRRILNGINWVKKLEIVERDANYGLECSIQYGLNSIFNNYGHEKAIVLEDDILVGKYFLRYMNEALAKYHHSHKVYHVAANSLNLEDTIDRDTYFLHSATCWGWGTWKRAWHQNLISMDANYLLKQLERKQLLDLLNFNGSSPYLGMLKKNAINGNSSWAIKWYTFLVLNGKLALHPYRSLTANIGMDGSGTNMNEKGKNRNSDLDLADDIDLEIELEDIPFELNKRAYKHYEQYYSAQSVLA